jgi:hypothetical protein
VDAEQAQRWEGRGHFFAAACLGVSPRKANQVWAYARAWLLEELGAEAD